MFHRFAIANLPVTPWKNGGGSTREIVCMPPGTGMDTFDWRVSIATIAQPGPFSVFTGIDRVIVLLDGDGVRLQSPAGIDHRLDTPLQPFAFRGEESLDCALLGGPSQDFNLMARRGVLRAEVTVLRRADALAPTASGLLLAARGPWSLSADDRRESLDAGQGLWWDQTPQGWLVSPRNDDAALLWARLDRIGA